MPGAPSTKFSKSKRNYKGNGEATYCGGTGVGAESDRAEVMLQSIVNNGDDEEHFIVLMPEQYAKGSVEKVARMYGAKAHGFESGSKAKQGGFLLIGADGCPEFAPDAEEAAKAVAAVHSANGAPPASPHAAALPEPPPLPLALALR